MQTGFETDVASIHRKIDLIDPVQYGKTRNYTDGAVTRLSPYISRGVISTRQVLRRMLEKGYVIRQMESFVKELCWRDYFQRVGQHKDLSRDLRPSVQDARRAGIPSAVLTATTGIEAIDRSVEGLYATGYMHNHCRMYTASLVCNVGGADWRNASQWMYYHLLDGDWASNACSWQWVSGAGSSKKYYANQENINTYTGTTQRGTFLDLSYEALVQCHVPQVLAETEVFSPDIWLPEGGTLQVDSELPTFVYNYYNLDPAWHAGEKGNRILLLDPSFFRRYPVSRTCLEFALALSRNIEGIQVFVGSFAELTERRNLATCHFKEHPLNHGYCGTEEPRDWICDAVTAYFPSFFGYWKKVSAQL